MASRVADGEVDGFRVGGRHALAEELAAAYQAVVDQAVAERALVGRLRAELADWQARALAAEEQLRTYAALLDGLGGGWR